MSRSEAAPDEIQDEPDEETFVGTGLNRVEDHRILTGRAEYIHDITPEACLSMGLLRTTHAHADIVDIDTSAAEDHPDCDLVLTGEDIAAEYNPMPCGLDSMSEWALARDTVRFVGEPVALVVADDRYVVEDLIDRIDVEYDTKEAITDPVTARQDETLVHEELGTNVPDKERLTFGDVDEAFEEADNVLENQYSWGRISGVPLETAGVVAEYDEEADSFDIDCNIQLHTLVDDTIYEPLGYDPDDVRLNVPPDVGGSYGTKIAIHRYCTLAAMASQQLDGRPVKYVEDRIENLQGGDMHCSDREYMMRLAYDDDGTIQGLDVNFVDDFGAYPHYPVNQALKPLSVVTNAYNIDPVRYNYELVLTNKTAQTAYRGFGVDPHLYALESVVDDAADDLGMEPYEFRQQNLIQPEQMPYKLPSKNIYDSGDFPGALARIKELVEDEERTEGGLLDPETVEQQREDGKYRGVSYTVHIEPGVSGADWTDRQRSDRDALADREMDDVDELPEHLRCEIEADGTVRTYLATDSSGQGHQTIVKQLLADQLEILPSDIEVDYLDSVEAPTEYGSAASRMAVMLSGATEGLGETVVDNLERLAARHWDVDRETVVYRDGGVEREDGTERLSRADLVEIDDETDGDRLTYAEYDYEFPVLDVEEFGEALTQKYPVYPTAAFAANAPIVEVDIETGEIEVLKFYSLRDCGTQLNPTIVEGQAHGGLAQGIGAALLEEFSYDQSGQPQAVTLFDYLLPSTKNIPEMHLEHTETPSPFTTTGAKGTGEGGMIDGPASIATAINRALEPFDITADRIPVTPDRIRKKLREE
ncbi:xanthine dehydrogenase family protein molybdopterin-binding subunit [Haloarcula sp. GH36]|uniref:xanthine dehydrogenase family protein molybdopterin-binding subunit n=1 Tax=Haloarcula montana TaxID=3111776 RepID=UPI002D79210C|nr:xanthine dehydrogenase family protein molybdopterin-binding subunit [Haloarcula sp. GH36]